MECIVQIYVFAQRLLAPFRHTVVTTDGCKQRLTALLSDLEYYVRGDEQLKLRWTPVSNFLRQEPGWIEWKNDGATDWTLPPISDHPWSEHNCRPMDEQTISEIHACLNESVDVDMADSEMQVDSEETSEMKATENLHLHFDRDLELPDFDELRVPTAKVSNSRQSSQWCQMWSAGISGQRIRESGRNGGVHGDARGRYLLLLAHLPTPL